MKIKILLLLLPLIFTGFACTKRAEEFKPEPITLRYWRVFDDSDSMADIIAAYNATRPHITIEYKKLRLEEYEKELLDALAEDRGPDILSLPNTWLGAYQTKLAPIPSQLEKIAIAQGQGNKVVYSLQTLKTKTARELQNEFIDTVYRDAVFDSQIYGLPLSVDTLALYSNRELLNKAGIPEPPRTWSEVQDAVRKLTVTTETGDIIQSGIAMGTTSNISRSADILAMLMMQNGTKIAENGAIQLNDSSNNSPSTDALIFYTDFASPEKSVYTWNNDQVDAVTAFSQSRVAMMLGYSYHMAQIKQRNPLINMSVTPLPQISAGPYSINIANYWLEAVSKKSQHQNYAWDFILFATRAENITKYLEKTKHPTALRALINTQRDDLDIFPFISQALTAKSWYKGGNAQVAESAMKETINTALKKEKSPQEALNIASSKIQATLMR